MVLIISDEERQAVRDGSNSTNALKSSYWKLPEHISDPELQMNYWRDVIRSNGLDGNLPEMMDGVLQAKAQIALMQEDHDLFNACKPNISGVLTDLLLPEAAAQSLLANLRPRDKAPRLKAAAARLNQFAQEFGPVLAPAAKWLAGEGPVEDLEQADLGIVAEFGLLSAPKELTEGDRYLTLYMTLQATVRLAQQAGLKTVLIPDFVFATLRNRPAHILSFHTAGLFPGFTHFKRGDLPGYMVLDAGGYSGWSTLSGANIADLSLPPLDEAKALCAKLWQDIVVANVSKYAQEAVTTDADPLPPKYVFVPLQVAGDRTQRKARFSMLEMLDMVVSKFRGTDTMVVVKPHPKSKDMEQIAKLMELVEAGDALMRFDSIHHLIAGAEAVITINSGVGSETLLHNKPIYCLGAADYDCVAHRIESVEQFTELTTPIRHAVSEADYIRFTAYYRKDYLVDWAQPGRLDAAIQERVIDPILAGR